ncbi:MAG: hypothetical protein HYY06_33365 [Deltaproteobacteria bacterium]|nr:hypothetical protein [Deltaproteobacteria bacterium]
MGFRDDLGAARARIAALEAALAAGGGSDASELARLNAERSSLLARVADLERRVEVQEAELDDARRRAHEAESRVATLKGTLGEPATGTPTLTEHNRQHVTTRTGTGAGVLCPMCLLVHGERVEMWLESGLYLVLADRRSRGGITINGVATGRASNTVLCPRCFHLAVKTTRGFE